jgi:hypothetical protein
MEINMGFATKLARLAAPVLVMAAVPAQAVVFRLTATDVMVFEPSPLFSSRTITGQLTLDESIRPGDSFGSAAITALTLNFGGIRGTLADIAADIAPESVQGFGTRSSDGRGFSVFDLRFGFQNGVPGCSFFCAGQIIINSPIGPADVSNFIAIDDVDGTTLSVIDSFTPQFGLVPEPASWGLMIVGFGLVGAAARRKAFAVQYAQRHVRKSSCAKS